MRGGARGRTVDEDAASEGDDEENHNEGGVALAGVALRPGVMRNFLAAEEVAGHLGHVHRREAVLVGRCVARSAATRGSTW